VERRDITWKNAEVAIQIREFEEVEEAREVQNTWKCFNCNEPGHFAHDCKKPKKGFRTQRIDTDWEDKRDVEIAKMKDTISILINKVEDLKDEEHWEK
jgi:Zinc knuckle